MAFVNKRLTQQEKELFRKRVIRNPLDYVNNSILVPAYWTIDRETQVFIFQIGVQRDWPNETVFFYQYKDEAIVLSIKRRYILPNTIIWSLDDTCFNPFNEMEDTRLIKEMKDALKLALETYKVKGITDSSSELTKVICEF